MPRKLFTPLQSCCESIAISAQEKLHSKFLELGDYHKQSILLSTLMKCNDPKEVNAHKISRLVIWTFLFSTDESVIVVCKKFLMGCLNLSQTKLRTVQGKMLNGESLVDGRGMHENRKVKLTDQVKQLIQ